MAAGIKEVTRTDVTKKAYVPTADQRQVLAIAGYQPGLHTDHTLIDIIDSRTGSRLRTSYYNSQRAGADRPPEARMGRGLLGIIGEGDRLLLGTDGVKVFARIVSSDDTAVVAPPRLSEAVATVYRQLDARRLLQRAKDAPAIPNAATVTRTEYVRDEAVREYVVRRSGGTCEVPECGWVGFGKDDGSRFIEVHHIQPLAEGGADTIENTAGICPNCHRRAHYGADRRALAAMLSNAVIRSNERVERALRVQP